MTTAPQLKPHHFKPGNPGGPGRASNWLKPGELKTVVGKMMRMSRQQLVVKTEDPTSTMLEVIVGKIIESAAKSGDANKFEMLLNRTIGKIREEIIFDDDGKPLALIHRPDGSVFEIVPLRKDDAGDADISQNSAPTP